MYVCWLQMDACSNEGVKRCAKLRIAFSGIESSIGYVGLAQHKLMTEKW